MITKREQTERMKANVQVNIKVIREIRAALLSPNGQTDYKSVAIAITKLDEAVLWLKETLELLDEN